MKNLSIVFNIILSIAVAILYYFHFSSHKIEEKKANTVRPAVTGTNVNRPAIAYVELDSLNEKISYIKSKRKELEAEQQAIFS